MIKDIIHDSFNLKSCIQEKTLFSLQKECQIYITLYTLHLFKNSIKDTISKLMRKHDKNEKIEEINLYTG